MTFIDWNDKFKIGVPSIDADHRRMAERLNDFCEASGKANAPSDMAARLTDLITEAEAHFKREETLLDQLNFPELPYHKQEHQRLMAQLRHFQGRLQDGNAEGGSDLANWLRQWLFDHIQQEDKAYRPFIMRLA